MPLYHYTSQLHLPHILGLGRLNPSESNVGSPWREESHPYGSHAGPDVVWLMDLDDPGQLGHGLDGGLDKRAVRFTIETQHAIPWLDWEPASRMSPEWREVFLDVAGGEEKAAHWYVVPGFVRKTLWREVALRDAKTGAYAPLEESEWR